MFVFPKETAAKLARLRKQSGLFQKEVAERIGINPKTGQSYVAQLEKGLIRNPCLSTILNYLDAIGVSWETFFRELSMLRSKQNHQKIMSQVKLPSNWSMQKKLDRDTLLYETKIKPPLNFYTKVNMDLVKQKVSEKVRAYCQNLNIKDNLTSHYIKFAHEILVVDSYKPIFNKYCVSGISIGYLNKIMNIANKVFRTEEKKVQRQKPTRTEKARSMAVKYLQNRVKLASVETEISQILEGHNLKENVFYNSYMNFVRECFGKIRKFHNKNPLLLKQHLKEIILAWEKSGLKKEILTEIQQKILMHFEPPQ